MQRQSDKKISVGLLSVGCPKNLVDSEIILGLLKEAGFEICDDITKAHVMLINTCAFIEEAKEESIDLILELIKLKKESQQKHLVVIGCLAQRYLPELTNEIPEVDMWITLPEIPQIAHLINKLIDRDESLKNNYTFTTQSNFLYDHTMPRFRITPGHYAYIKIAEGCSNRCSYCAVPNIKGGYKSRNMDSIIIEAEELVNQGTNEINLIAQDTTNYGADLHNGSNLAKLVRKLCTIKNLKWLRMLYAHPAHITKELIEEIAIQPKICKYIDLPLQHIDDGMLLLMGRKVDSKYIRNLIKMIRIKIPDVIFRTSFIVGFPGETEEKFNTLLEFMEEIKFERLGIFSYSHEEGTPAYNMHDQVPETIKTQRFHKAMQLQQDISKEVNRRFLNKSMDIIVEGLSEENENLWYGRSYADAPEVDGSVYIYGDSLKQGDIIKVKITDTMEYDLVAETTAKADQKPETRSAYR